MPGFLCLSLRIRRNTDLLNQVQTYDGVNILRFIRPPLTNPKKFMSSKDEFH